MNIMWWLYTNTATNWEVCLPFSGFPLDFLSLYSTCFCSSSSGKNIALAMIDLDQGEFISFLNFFFNFGAFSYVSYVTSVQCTEDFVDFIWEGKFFWCAIFLNKKKFTTFQIIVWIFFKFQQQIYLMKKIHWTTHWILFRKINAQSHSDFFCIHWLWYHLKYTELFIISLFAGNSRIFYEVQVVEKFPYRLKNLIIKS